MKLSTLPTLLVIVLLAIAPLFGTFPYRLNIYLSYEGAYRLYLGQIPYKDFGLPMGPVFWVVPALFFKIFGPQLFTLIKAQVFLNIISGISFLSILKSLKVNTNVLLISVLLFAVSYSLPNFWPWYNHSVIVYELVTLAFLLKFIFCHTSRRYWWLILSAVFTVITFFTKQDGGGLTLLLCFVLLAYNSYEEKSYKQLLVYLLVTMGLGLLFIIPFRNYSFAYWFNYGQSPHSSRMSLSDIINDFLNESIWLKFYFIAVLIALVAYSHYRKRNTADKHIVVFSILTIGILIEAVIFQVTSYVPQDNNIFFHSFAIAFLFTIIARLSPPVFSSWKLTLVFCAGVMLWWSQIYWRYVDHFIIGKKCNHASYSSVNKNTYLIIPIDTTDVPLSKWRTIPLKSFNRILLPGPTADGIERLIKMPVWQNKDAHVLNMTELTPLANELHYKLETGSQYPLWYHKGVGMFQKETDMYCDRIRNNFYDVVLFEYIPYLNNFYPFEVRNTLLQYYDRVDSFTAPRKPSFQAWVEVYVRKK